MNVQYVVIKKTVCSSCNGEGLTPNQRPAEKCPDCEGGFVREEVDLADALRDLSTNRESPEPNLYGGMRLATSSKHRIPMWKPPSNEADATTPETTKENGDPAD